MDPRTPTKNKPGSLKWWPEIFGRWLGFMKQGAKEVINTVKGKKS